MKQRRFLVHERRGQGRDEPLRRQPGPERLSEGRRVRHDRRAELLASGSRSPAASTRRSPSPSSASRPSFSPLAQTWPPSYRAKGGARVPRIEKKDTEQLEKMVDELQGKLPRLTSFILPGGSQLSSSLHLARAVCRRAERRVVALSRAEKINPEMVPYLNRLSTYLFNAGALRERPRRSRGRGLEAKVSRICARPCGCPRSLPSQGRTR